MLAELQPLQGRSKAFVILAVGQQTPGTQGSQLITNLESKSFAQMDSFQPFQPR